MFVSFANKQVNDYPCDSKPVEGMKVGKEAKKKQAKEETKSPPRKKVYRNMAFVESSNSITKITQNADKKYKGQKQPSNRAMVVPVPHLHHPHHHLNNTKYPKHSYPRQHELKLVGTTKF